MKKEQNCHECGLPEQAHPGRICDEFVPPPRVSVWKRLAQAVGNAIGEAKFGG